MRFFKLALILLSIGLFVFACSQPDTTKTTNVTPTNSNAAAATPVAQPTAAANDEMASAKKNYTEKCARCHKDDGSSGKIVIDGQKINAKSLITDHIKKDPDSDYVEAIREGFPDDGMPAFKGKLTDAEINGIVKYIRTELQK